MFLQARDNSYRMFLQAMDNSYIIQDDSQRLWECFCNDATDNSMTLTSYVIEFAFVNSLPQVCHSMLPQSHV
jgi:hypothetical protein